MALKVEKFFCVSLPKATLTIGFLTIVLGLLQVVTSAMRLIYLYDREDEEDFTIMHHYRIVRKMHIIELGIFAHCLGILSGILLIIGTIKKSHLLFLPWLVMTAPAVIFGIGMAIYFLISETRGVDGMIIFLSSVGVLFLTGFQIYMWIAVFSFSCEIREEKNRERRVQYDSQPESANTADEECNPKHAFQRI